MLDARVWAAPLLRELDERGRADVERASSVRVFPEGTTIYREGGPADAVFVVLDGEVGLGLLGGQSRRGSVGAGELFGEEAALVDAPGRLSDARSMAASRIVEIPARVLVRSVVRAGGDRALDGERRRWRRNVAVDGVAELTLSESKRREAERIVDAGKHRVLDAGGVLFDDEAGTTEPADWLVLAGGLSVTRRTAESGEVERYEGVGSVVPSGDSQIVRVAAVGRSWVLELPAGTGLAGEAEVADERARRDPKSVYRLELATNWLAIDPSACVRCGQCSWACGVAHADGVSRLDRSGAIVPVDCEGGHSLPMIATTSCQHCTHAACIDVCPTAAIVRNDEGLVDIVEDRCTGCGACERACPWNVVSLGPSKNNQALGAIVARKCDACVGRTLGPACVDACPTGAAVRIDSSRSMPTRAPVSARAWPIALAAVVAVSLGVAALSFAVSSDRMSGACALTGFVVLAASRPIKRLFLSAPGRQKGGARAGTMATALHLGVGLAATLALAAHPTPSGLDAVAFAAWVAALAATTLGTFGVVAWLLLPRRLAALAPALSGVSGARAGDRDEQELFDALSGERDAVKLLGMRVAWPYGRSRIGALGWLLFGVDRGGATRALDERLRGIIGDRLGESGASLSRLARLAVRRRALRAARWVLVIERGWWLPHAVFGALALALGAAHGLLEVLAR